MRLNLKEASRKITGTLILGARAGGAGLQTRTSDASRPYHRPGAVTCMATRPIPERNHPQTSQLFRNNLILPYSRARQSGQTGESSDPRHQQPLGNPDRRAGVAAGRNQRRSDGSVVATLFLFRTDQVSFLFCQPKSINIDFAKALPTIPDLCRVG